MKTVTLTNANWHRGLGGGGSMLYNKANPNARLCCLGNMLRQEGYDTSRDWASVGQMLHNLRGNMPPELKRLEESGATLDTVYHMNDMVAPLTDADRVQLLNELTMPFGIRFVFQKETQHGA